MLGTIQPTRVVC